MSQRFSSSGSDLPQIFSCRSGWELRRRQHGTWGQPLSKARMGRAEGADPTSKTAAPIQLQWGRSVVDAVWREYWGAPLADLDDAL